MKQCIMTLLLLFPLWASDQVDTLVGSRAYPFFLKDLNSNPSTFYKMKEQISNGNAVVIAFFAEWCNPCRNELPLLDSLSQAHEDVSVVAVSLDKVYPKDLIGDLGLTMPVLHDKFKIISKKYGYGGKLPYTVYVGKGGVIKDCSYGYNDEKRSKIIAFVEELSK